MTKWITLIVFTTLSVLFAQHPYNVGDTVLPADNLSWTDNTGYTTNIFDEIAVNKRPVVIFWGGAG